MGKRMNGFLQIDVHIVDWTSAFLNGERDAQGNMPLREGDRWQLLIVLETGKIVGWPSPSTAQVFYVAAPGGEYWLLDASQERMAKWKGRYGLADLLCASGDMVFRINETGHIVNWQQPFLDRDAWDFKVAA